MAIDPSIPLAVDTAPVVDLQQVMARGLANQNSLLEIQAAKQKMQLQNQQLQQQNALKAVLSRPGAMDPVTGGVSDNTLKAVMQIDPETGMRLQQQAVQSRRQATLDRIGQSKLGQEQIDRAHDAMGSALITYEESKNKVGDQNARQLAQKSWDETYGNLENSGLYSPEVLRQIPRTFDPTNFLSLTTAVKNYYAERDKQETEKRLAKQAMALEAHRDHMESLSERRLAAMENRSSLEKYSTPKMVETADGKRVLAQQETQGPNQGRWVSADENRTPIQNVGKVLSSTEAAFHGPDMENPADKLYAEKIANYEILPPTAGRNPEQRRQWIEAALKLNPNYDETQASARKKVVDAFAGGMEGRKVTALNTAVAHLDTAQQLAKALKNHDMQLYNTVKNRFESEFGVPAPTNLQAASQLIGGEIVNALVSTGGGQEERREAQEQFSQKLSPEQLEGKVHTYQQLLGGRLRALQQQYEQGTHRKDFGDKLLPETKKALGFAEAGHRTDANLPPAPEGVDAADWKYMTPEERKLWQK